MQDIDNIQPHLQTQRQLGVGDGETVGELSPAIFKKSIKCPDHGKKKAT